MNAHADIVELLRAIMRSELATVHVADIGVVTRTHPHAAASDKKNYACDVKLRDSGLELKAVPVATQRIGHEGERATTRVNAMSKRCASGAVPRA